jgi:hypothetical protein
MNIKCLFGSHNWDGCKCSECAKIQDKLHKWDGCKCSICGITRDEQHDWSKDCEICAICGNHSSITKHKWDRCKCIKCGKTRNEGHSWLKCKCQICGENRDSCHNWDVAKCTICGKQKPAGDALEKSNEIDREQRRVDYLAKILEYKGNWKFGNKEYNEWLELIREIEDKQFQIEAKLFGSSKREELVADVADMKSVADTLIINHPYIIVQLLGFEGLLQQGDIQGYTAKEKEGILHSLKQSFENMICHIGNESSEDIVKEATLSWQSIVLRFNKKWSSIHLHEFEKFKIPISESTYFGNLLGITFSTSKRRAMYRFGKEAERNTIPKKTDNRLYFFNYSIEIDYEEKSELVYKIVIQDLEQLEKHCKERNISDSKIYYLGKNKKEIVNIFGNPQVSRNGLESQISFGMGSSFLLQKVFSYTSFDYDLTFYFEDSDSCNKIEVGYFHP